MFKLKIEAKIENLDTVLSFIGERLEPAHCSMKHRNQIAIVVEEIFVNIANYAYGHKNGNVTISLSIGNKVIIKFEDSGKPYNPLEKEDPDISLNAEKREIGGLGIFMVKKMMDVVEYYYKNEKNILIIEKTIA